MAGEVLKAVAVDVAVSVASKVVMKLLQDATVKLPLGDVQLLYASNVNLRYAIKADEVERKLRPALEKLRVRTDLNQASWVTYGSQDFWVVMSLSFANLRLVDDEEEAEFLEDEPDDELELDPVIDSISFSVIPKGPKSLEATLPGYSLASRLGTEVVNAFPSFSPDYFLYVYGPRRTLDRLQEFLLREGALPVDSIERASEPAGEYAKFASISAKAAGLIVRALDIVGRRAVTKWIKKSGWKKAVNGLM